MEVYNDRFVPKTREETAHVCLRLLQLRPIFSRKLEQFPLPHNLCYLASSACRQGLDQPAVVAPCRHSRNILWTNLGITPQWNKANFTQDRESIHPRLISILGFWWTLRQSYTQYKLQRKNKLQKRKTTTKTENYSLIPEQDENKK